MKKRKLEMSIVFENGDRYGASVELSNPITKEEECEIEDLKTIILVYADDEKRKAYLTRK